MNVRFYGSEPYKIAVVHGGPGAPGSVAGLAKELAIKYGVIEPLQTKYSINELIEELKNQIEEYCAPPVALIGHSWGAWLAGFVAEKYPGLIGKLVLVGCGPLETKYVAEIGASRKSNMSEEARVEFDELLLCLDKENSADKDSKLARLGALVRKADYYDEIEPMPETEDPLPSNGEIYSRIWPEAAGLRESGQLLASFKNKTCPIVLLQGENDPHPYKGVAEPLEKLKTYVIEKCGHTPWRERYARESFYQTLFDEIDFAM